jgi:ATP-dependent Clp protease, protease subunit
MTRTWFTAKAENKIGEIAIYDEIGLWGISAADFIAEVKALGNVSQINLSINSPGGSVFDGLAIHNALKRHKATVNVTIDGVAASIASVIAMAGDDIAIPDNAFMMVHDPSGFAAGTSKDMRELAEALDKIKTGLISAYAGKTGMDREEIADLMAAETWLTASEAVELGFADRIEEPVRMAASFDLSKFRNAPASAVSPRGFPAALNSSEQEGNQMSEHETTAEEPVVAAGETESAAIETAPVTEAVEAVAQVAQAEAPAVDPVAQANARASQIVALCVNAGIVAKAADYIASGKDAGEVAIDILNARAPASTPNTEITARHVPVQAASANWGKVIDRFKAQAKS